MPLYSPLQSSRWIARALNFLASDHAAQGGPDGFSESTVQASLAKNQPSAPPTWAKSPAPGLATAAHSKDAELWPYRAKPPGADGKFGLSMRQVRALIENIAMIAQA